MTVTNEHLAYRPGGVSAFFVYKAGFMAVGFWAWLAVLTVRGSALSSWHLLAAAGAITMTLVTVLLSVRHALARHAASRHEQIMKTLVDLSWQSFATPPSGIPRPSTTLQPATPSPSASDVQPTRPTDGNTDADVIRFSHESRQRPRR